MIRKSILVILMATTVSYAQVGIGTLTPHASSILDVESSTQGFLPPRLTEAQRDAITNPAAGLMIYNLTSNCLEWNKGNGTHDWHHPCTYTPPAPAAVFDSLTVKMNAIAGSRFLTSTVDEPKVSPLDRVGANLTNCFENWLQDAYDYGGWIFIDQPNVNDIASANILPYSTNVGSTGGVLSTHPLLNGKQYFTNFSTNRKIFSFYAQTENNTSIKFVSDSGIDGHSTSSIYGDNVSANGKYHMYYQSANTSAAGNDAFVTHLFFVRIAESSTITFGAHNTDLGLTIGNQSPAADDYSAILSWPNAGDVLEVYGFMMVLGQNDIDQGPVATVAELEAIGNQIVNDVLP
ncbi:MAG: hypothetical protein N4A45_06145 [Flavobacteriales bacterium]|jgi:hypothetical protein|nr:hypothetical protein [Flavobacteriales bacterium]